MHLYVVYLYSIIIKPISTDTAGVTFKSKLACFVCKSVET